MYCLDYVHFMLVWDDFALGDYVYFILVWEDFIPKNYIQFDFSIGGSGQRGLCCLILVWQ